MANFIGIDIGTSSVKAVLIDERQSALADASAPLEVSRPRPLWSEQDPEDWWRGTLAVVAELRAKASKDMAGVASLGLSGQQHGATLLDASGAVLRPAILWNDGRSFVQCAELLDGVPDFTRRSSNLPMPGFTAPKLLWVAEHEPDVFAGVAKVVLPKDYVRFRMTGAYVSDLSDAAGTLWLDVARRDWDDVLLAATGLTRAHMPALVEGSTVSAHLKPELARAWGIDARVVPVAGGGGDNAASAVGMGAVNPGDGFLSPGTSGVSFVATDHPIALPERTLHSFCHALPGRWHGMSVSLTAAAALEWIARIVGRAADLPRLLADVEAFAADATNRARAPIFLPYLGGERTPHNDPDATAQFAGLRIGHGAEALAYAVLEGVAFSLADGLDVLAEAGAEPANCLLVGGGSRSEFWAQLISDVTRAPLDLPRDGEIGAAFGAARLAMLAGGRPEAEACAKRPIRRHIEPGPEDHGERRRRMRALYVRAGTATKA
jgi:xylulokinase